MEENLGAVVLKVRMYFILLEEGHQLSNFIIKMRKLKTNGYDATVVSIRDPDRYKSTYSKKHLIIIFIADSYRKKNWSSGCHCISQLLSSKAHVGFRIYWTISDSGCQSCNVILTMRVVSFFRLLKLRFFIFVLRTFLIFPFFQPFICLPLRME